MMPIVFGEPSLFSGSEFLPASGVVIKANPQNGVLALRSILKPTLLNEFKVRFNEAYTRINSFAPTVNGIDLFAIAINISGNTANFGLRVDVTMVALSEEIWRSACGDDAPFNAQSLHVHIYRLRQLPAPFRLHIETRVCSGYCLTKKVMSNE